MLAVGEPEKGSYHGYTFVEAPQDCQKGKPNHDRPKAAQDRDPVKHCKRFSGSNILEKLTYGNGSPKEHLTMRNSKDVASMTECEPTQLHLPPATAAVHVSVLLYDSYVNPKQQVEQGEE